MDKQEYIYCYENRGHSLSFFECLISGRYSRLACDIHGGYMKKIWRVLILGELILCLMLAGMYGLKNSAQWQQAAVLSELEESEVQQEKEIRRIALTFDDGPHPRYTEQLLDGLKERGVHATFFVTGEHAELHPDIIKRMQEDA